MRHAAPSLSRDLLELAKPSITGLSVFMAIGGLWLANHAVLSTWIATVLGVGLVVASANALNMYLEKETDALMQRTADRPLPAGRLAPPWALAAGFVYGIIGVSVLALWTTPMTTVLSGLSLVLYVGVYTPMKRHSPLALAVGAIPGAAPPLLGWTAATGTVDGPGLVLFAVLFLWQMPHFLAISLFRKADYARAGMKTVPIIRGDRAARLQALAYATALLPISLMLIPLGTVGWAYFVVATASGFGFWWIALQGILVNADVQWARKLFFASLVYLPVLIGGVAWTAF